MEYAVFLSHGVARRGGGATDTAGVLKTSGATDTLCRAVGQPLAWKMTGVGATDTVDKKLI